jgi:hypothetical protein
MFGVVELLLLPFKVGISEWVIKEPELEFFAKDTSYGLINNGDRHFFLIDKFRQMIAVSAAFHVHIAARR